MEQSDAREGQLTRSGDVMVGVFDTVLWILTLGWQLDLCKR